MSDSKQGQQWEVNQEIRNWLDLPSDVTTNILHRIGVIEILENAEKVCTTWRGICKDPAMWKVILMENISEIFAVRSPEEMVKMCKHAVDRSQGQLVDITFFHFANDELIRYVADSELRRLQITCGNPGVLKSLKVSLKKFPLLEELNLYKMKNSKEAIEAAGRHCPMLRTLRVNQEAFRFWPWENSGSIKTRGKTAIAIGENLHELRHLELIGNNISNVGLQVILDGCPHLELLDLRRCLYIDLTGDLGKKCSEKIKCVKLPNDSLEGCLYYDSYSDDDVDDANHDVWREILDYYG